MLLVTFQLALAVVLTTAGVLCLKSFLRLSDVGPGFEAKAVVAAQLVVRRSQLNLEGFLALQATILEAARGVPNVDSAGLASQLPLLSKSQSHLFVRRGSMHRSCVFFKVAGEYFRTMGMSVLSGRPFADSESRVAIVGETMARQFWGSQNALGDHLLMDGEKTPREVIGVVNDVKTSEMSQDPESQVYLPDNRSNAATVPLTLVVGAAEIAVL